MAGSVWLVTSGSYSDYRVHCAAPTRELAEKIRDRVGADDVTERPLLSRVGEYIKLVSYQARVSIDATGRIGEVYSFGDRDLRPPTRPRASADSFGNVSITIQAASPDQAVHAAKEYATELAAELAAGVAPKDAAVGFNDRHSLSPAAD